MDDNCLFIAIQMLEKQKEIQDRSLEPNVCHSMPLPVDPISRGNEEEEVVCCLFLKKQRFNWASPE